MRRYTTTNVKLADGTVIPKDNVTMVVSSHHWNPEVYDNPHEFNGHRFLKMRQESGKENKSQFVSVSPEHMGFGYGAHACPGRFLVSDEVKLSLGHLLLKYDLKLVDGSSIEPLRVGVTLNANPTAKLLIRRREEELQV